MNEPEQLEYARPRRYAAWDWEPAASVAAGGATLLMDLLWWAGTLIGQRHLILIAAACITFALPLTGLFLACWNSRTQLARLGFFASLAGGGIYVGLIVYFFCHLPTY